MIAQDMVQPSLWGQSGITIRKVRGVLVQMHRGEGMQGKGSSTDMWNIPPSKEEAMNVPHADALVCSAPRDLAHKKIFPSLQAMVKRGHLNVPVIGVAKAGWNLEQLRAVLERRATRRRTRPRRFRQAVQPAPLCGRRLPRRGDLSGHPQGAGLRAASAHYLAIPPALFGLVVEQLAQADCTKGARVIVEKPFGHDRASAQELNRILLGTFDETSIFRIDHYLGKRPVHNMVFFRFENALGVILEPHSGRKRADHDGRGFWHPGARGRSTIKPGQSAMWFKNHLFQVLPNLAMEPPVRTDSETIRDEKVKVLRLFRLWRRRMLCADSFVATGRRTAWRPTRKSKPSPRSSCTSIPGVGKASPSTSGLGSRYR